MSPCPGRFRTRTSSWSGPGSCATPIAEWCNGCRAPVPVRGVWHAGAGRTYAWRDNRQATETVPHRANVRGRQGYPGRLRGLHRTEQRHAWRRAPCRLRARGCKERHRDRLVPGHPQDSSARRSGQRGVPGHVPRRHNPYDPRHPRLRRIHGGGQADAVLQRVDNRGGHRPRASDRRARNNRRVLGRSCSRPACSTRPAGSRCRTPASHWP